MIDEVLAYLVKRGAHIEPAKITTREIAYDLGISQQTASRKIIELIRGRRIERTADGIVIVPAAVGQLKRTVDELQHALYPELGFEFSGKVVTGLGEGAMFMKMQHYKDSIKKQLGFSPYPGTLNVRISPEEVEKRLRLKTHPPIVITGFRQDGKDFGKILCYRCKIMGVKGAAVFPVRSAHGLNVLELIAPVNLRKELSLDSHGWVEFTAYP
ncbi:MAG: DUF120 domain-containing protein [Candidatus Micrarchaeia archaeon]